MRGTSTTPPSNFAPALEAIGNLAAQELREAFDIGQTAGLKANAEIAVAPVNQKTGPVYRHLLPFRKKLVSLLADSYRRYFTLALAHPRETGNQPDQWASQAIQTAINTTPEWLRDWFILACDGENRYVQKVASVPFVPGGTVSISIPLTAPPLPPPSSWRAPAWLFQVSLPFVGIALLKTKHVPATDSEEKLGAAHTRLLLKGARRVFLWELAVAIERVRNEEIATAGAIPPVTVREQIRRPNKRRGWEQRGKLYEVIRKVLNGDPSLQGMDLCAELDKRHARPLYDWTKRGEWREGLMWKEAWGNLSLRRKIRRVRQEAMKGR